MLSDSWRHAWDVPDRRPTYDWAKDGNIYLPPCYTISGLFQVDSSLWLVPIFDALDDCVTHHVTVIAPPRSGKSMIADVWVPGAIVRDPGGDIQWILQTKDVVKDYAESRIQPILQACPGIQAIWPDDRHKGSTLRVGFKNGCNLYISGPAISKLQTKGIRRQVRDETWLWKRGRLTEAESRLKDWLRIGSAKALTVSQGSWKDDETHVLFTDGDQCERFVRCLHCGHLQWPRFNAFRPDGSRWGVRYDEPKRERTDHRALSQLLGQILPTVRFECERCRQPMEDSERTRSEWNRNGEYVGQNKEPKPGFRSFRASGVLFRNWKEMVTQFIGAMDAYNMGIIEPLEGFIQKEIPDFFSDAALFRADPIQKEQYDIDSLKKGKWEEDEVRFLTIDRQDEGENFGVVRVWSKTKGSRRLWRGRLYSKDEIKAKQEEFSIDPGKVLIDARWDSRNVYAMCIENGWTALMGDAAPFFLHPIKETDGRVVGYVRRSYSQPGQGDPEMGRKTHERVRRQGARYAYFIRFSSDRMNERLQRLLDGRGLPFVNPAEVEDPREEEVYHKHLRAEYKKKEWTPTGVPKIKWVCPSKQNHYRDCEKMQTAAATILNILADELEQPATPAETPEVEEKE